MHGEKFVVGAAGRGLCIRHRRPGHEEEKRQEVPHDCLRLLAAGCEGDCHLSSGQFCRAKNRAVLVPAGGKRGFAEGRRLIETEGRDYAATFARAGGRIIVPPEDHPPISLSCSERTEKSLRY